MKAKDIRALTTDQMLEKEKQYKEELLICVSNKQRVN